MTPTESMPGAHGVMWIRTVCSRMQAVNGLGSVHGNVILATVLWGPRPLEGATGVGVSLHERARAHLRYRKFRSPLWAQHGRSPFLWYCDQLAPRTRATIPGLRRKGVFPDWHWPRLPRGMHQGARSSLSVLGNALHSPPVGRSAQLRLVLS